MASTTIEVDRIVRFLAEFTEEYEVVHFGKRLTEINSSVDGIATTDPETFLKFVYHHYAFNRAGGAKAGYNDIAVKSLEEVGSCDPTALWKEFQDRCDARDIGVNKRVNHGAVTGPATLVRSNGNLFEWIADEIQAMQTIQPLYTEVNGIQGFGEKITRFFLRDAVWITGVEPLLSDEDGQYIQPMDVWTRRIINLLDDDSWGLPDNELSQRAAQACSEAGVSNAEFNQGAWYYGAKSMDGDTEAMVRNLLQL